LARTSSATACSVPVCGSPAGIRYTPSRSTAAPAAFSERQARMRAVAFSVGSDRINSCQDILCIDYYV